MAGDPASSFEVFKRIPLNIVLKKYIKKFENVG